MALAVVRPLPLWCAISHIALMAYSVFFVSILLFNMSRVKSQAAKGDFGGRNRAFSSRWTAHSTPRPNPCNKDRDCHLNDGGYDCRSKSATPKGSREARGFDIFSSPPLAAIPFDLRLNSSRCRDSVALSVVEMRWHLRGVISWCTIPRCSNLLPSIARSVLVQTFRARQTSGLPPSVTPAEAGAHLSLRRSALLATLTPSCGS
jgi:hypothetical protein